MTRLYTVGYEGRTQEAIITALADAGVAVLLDVRWRPLSRKRGLSKTALAAACAVAGIEYRHDRRLGTPPEILQRLRSEGIYDWDAYAAHLETQHAALEDAEEISTAARTALLCYEANPQECHRLLVATRVGSDASLGVVHL